MGYYVRVFCKSGKKPNVRQVLEHINSLGRSYRAESDLNLEEMEVADWTDFELRYDPGKNPILVECNNIGDENGIAEGEIEEFIETIGKPGLFASKKKKVIQHLRDTKYIIANQLLTGDINSIGYDANKEFLKYFVDNYEGLLQVDAEGFYEGGKVIVKTQ